MVTCQQRLAYLSLNNDHFLGDFQGWLLYTSLAVYKNTVSWTKKIGEWSYPCFVDCVLVELDEPVDRVFANFETGQMRQEVVADEEAHEHPVVNGALEVVGKRQVRHFLRRKKSKKVVQLLKWLNSTVHILQNSEKNLLNFTDVQDIISI